VDNAAETDKTVNFGILRPDFPSGCAVVFGGSGGLGRGIAGLLAQRGCNVIVTYRERKAQAESAVDDIRRTGREAFAVQCDVRNAESVADVVAAGVKEFGRVHTAIAAQGGTFERGALAAASSDGLRAKLETDVFGFLNIAQAAMPSLRLAGGGSLTAIVSPAVLRTLPGYGLGATPKAAVATMVKYFAADEGPHGVRVNAVAPGVINAGMAIKLSDGAGKAALDAAVQVTALRRMGEAAEVAELVVFLASAKGGYVTGQVIMADGGFSL
jgi:NAD(P)-dependent dehydrogenase (short-subunit alcohol dehydrogenase family)